MQTHAPHHSAEEIDRHVRTYLMVFGALLVLTLATVGAWAFLHLPLGATIALALFIAVVKGSLVACFFMHLISEKKLIHYVLVLTVIFFFALLLLPMITSQADRVGA